MLLIADSGSTKTDWILHTPEGRRDFETLGLNPWFVNAQQVSEVLAAAVIGVSAVSKVYFYGAGCSSPDNCTIVADGIRSVFPKAIIEVSHDLLGAARATCLGSKGIACILGTGSNSCLFDGSRIVDNIPALGYVLGDEGSGSYLGKELLRRHFYRELDADLNSELSKQLKGVNVIDKIMREESPNRYLAGFASFLEAHQKHPQVIELVSASFETFLKRHVSKYEGYSKLPVHFVGGIAYSFTNLLKQTCEIQHINLGLILKRPIDNLLKFHLDEN